VADSCGASWTGFHLPLIRFTAYTALAGGLWNTIFVVLGYQPGSRWTTIGDYSDLINATAFVAIGVAIVVFVVRRVRRRVHAGRGGGPNGG